ncbi:MAG TPA: hypothetical protein VN081_05755 [Dongiaceae bacterium]|nr:hypothetical protein [Dongiaceae bacterium]
MKHLTNLQHSLIRFAITVILYGLYCWFLYEAIELYFHPERYALVVCLFVTVGALTYLFTRYMPKRKPLAVHVEVK